MMVFGDTGKKFFRLYKDNTIYLFIARLRFNKSVAMAAFRKWGTHIRVLS
jgi:hypothetical protein